MDTQTKFVILMHPYEYRRIKLNTGRLTHLCLANSEIHVGETFDENESVRRMICDPENFPVLLYPGSDALDLSKGELKTGQIEGKQLVVFLIDATWRLARPMLRFSRCLQALPRIMFRQSQPSRYVIKKQPEAGCLSTLEAVHELLLALDRFGLDRYTMPDQLIAHFLKMQEYQLKRMPDRVSDSRLRSLEGKKEAGRTGKDATNPCKRRRVFVDTARSDESCS